MPAFSPPAETHPAPVRSTPRLDKSRQPVRSDKPEPGLQQPVIRSPDWSQRFQLLAVTRSINGVVSARLRDRTTNQEYKVASYDGIDSFVVTGIDFNAQAVTLVDTKMVPATITMRD